MLSKNTIERNGTIELSECSLIQYSDAKVDY